MKKFGRRPPTSRPQPSRGCVPFVPWEFPVCPADTLSNLCGITHKSGRDAPQTILGMLPRQTDHHTPSCVLCLSVFLLPNLAPLEPDFGVEFWDMNFWAPNLRAELWGRFYCCCSLQKRRRRPLKNSLSWIHPCKFNSEIGLKNSHWQWLHFCRAISLTMSIECLTSWKSVHVTMGVWWGCPMHRVNDEIARHVQQAGDHCHTYLQTPPRGPFSYPCVSIVEVGHSQVQWVIFSGSCLTAVGSLRYTRSQGSKSPKHQRHAPAEWNLRDISVFHTVLSVIFVKFSDLDTQILENVALHDRQIAHLICVRLKHLLFDFLGRALGLPPVVFLI